MVKQGYKPTEIGVIPEDWEVKELEELSLTKGLIRGPFGGALKKEVFVPKGFKVYEQKNAIYKSVKLGNYFIPKDKFDELKRFEVKTDDFILSCSGTIGRIYRLPKNLKPGIINQALLIIRLNEDVINLSYFEHIFNDDKIQNKIIDDTQGGAMKNLVGMSEFKKTLFPLPPLAEQEAIAEALSDADAWIESLEQLIAKKRLIKQGAMQELLTPKEDWEVKKLGDYVKFQTGFPFSSEFFNTKMIGERLIKNRDLRSDDSIFYYSGEFKKDFIVNNGDLLIGMDGDFEPVLWKKGRALLNQRVGRILKLKDISITYLAYSLIDKLKEIEESTGSTTVKHLSHSDIENLEYKIPSLSEQERIATILSDMDAELEALEKQLDKAQQIKQGMMQELLTGRVRLV